MQLRGTTQRSRGTCPVPPSVTPAELIHPHNQNTGWAQSPGQTRAPPAFLVPAKCVFSSRAWSHVQALSTNGVQVQRLALIRTPPVTYLPHTVTFAVVSPAGYRHWRTRQVEILLLPLPFDTGTLHGSCFDENWSPPIPSLASQQPSCWSSRFLTPCLSTVAFCQHLGTSWPR